MMAIIMFAKDYLEATVGKLSSNGKKTKVDENFHKYIDAIDNAFNEFINSIKDQPPESQLQYISTNMAQDSELSARMKKLSGDKRIWTFMFVIAAAANERNENLPKNHPEKPYIDAVLSGFSQGWVNGFYRVFPPAINKEALNQIKDGLNSWLEHYDIHANPEISQEVLWVLYSAACYFEPKLEGSKLIPKELSNVLTQLKAAIVNKLQEFTKEEALAKEKEEPLVGVESVVPLVSGALQQLAPKENPYEQFMKELASIKSQEDENLKLNDRVKSNQLRHARMQHLSKILKCQLVDRVIEDPMIAFWEHYNTQTKFNQLMVDLEIEDTQQEHWQRFFDAQHGMGYKNAIATVLLILPNGIGGIPNNALSVEVLLDKNNKTLKQLDADFKKKKEYEKRINSKEEKPSKLIEKIENELQKLVVPEKLDLQILKEKRSHIKKTTDLEKINIADVFHDFEKFQENLAKQKEFLIHLQNIHKIITRLSTHGINTNQLLKSFESILTQAIETIVHDDKSIDPLKSTEETINVLIDGIDKAQQETKEIKKGIEEIVKINSQTNNNPEKKAEILSATESFIKKYENDIFHKILCFFSKTYNQLFSSLKTAVEGKNSVQIASILGTQTAEYSKKHRIAMLFSEVQELQTLGTFPGKNLEETQPQGIPANG